MACVLRIMRVFVPVNVPGYLKNGFLFMGRACFGAYRTNQHLIEEALLEISWHVVGCLRIHYHGEVSRPRNWYPKPLFQLVTAKWPQSRVIDAMLHHLVKNSLLFLEETCVLLLSV